VCKWYRFTRSYMVSLFPFSPIFAVQHNNLMHNSCQRMIGEAYSLHLQGPALQRSSYMDLGM
jgi:hypothetical protein